MARRRSMVQVPPQTIYSMETIGDVPAIRFETNIQHAVTIHVDPPVGSCHKLRYPLFLPFMLIDAVGQGRLFDSCLACEDETGKATHPVNTRHACRRHSPVVHL